jgi:hypothetical protein
MESQYSSAGRAVTAVAGLRAAALLLFLSVIAAPSAFGQMGSSAVYSDMWVNDSSAPAENVEGAPPPPYTVVGTGVTQDNYNSYGHTYWVVTTLRSPNGRTASVTSYKTSSYSAYTRGDVSLSYDLTDLGQFTVNTTHRMCCPYMGGNPYTEYNCYGGSSTSVSGIIGASIGCYVLHSFNPATQVAVYNRKVPCADTRCGGQTVNYRYSGSPPPILQTVTPYQRYGVLTICSPIFITRHVSQCECGDIEANICAIYPDFPLCN